MNEESKQLSDNELIIQQDYLKDQGYIARQAIKAYVEQDEPIPNELKAILFKILDQDYPKKKTKETEAFWRTKITEVCFLIKYDELTTNIAIQRVAFDNDIESSTLERRYKDGKYRRIKDTIKGV